MKRRAVFFSQVRGAWTALTDWPARHSGAALLLLVMLAVGGIALGSSLPLEREPFMPGTKLAVHAHLPGIDAAQVERLVVLPLEAALADVPGLTGITARASHGRATIELEFPSAAVRERALDATRWRLALLGSLPAGMEPPVIERRDPRPRAAVVYAITAEVWSDDVLRWIERDLRRPLQELAQTSGATLEGVDAAEVLIQPDPRRLVTLGLSLDDLIQILQRTDPATARPASGVATAAAASVQAVAARTLRLPGGEPIALAELAQVSIVRHPAGERPRYEGQPALLLRVTPRSTREATDAAQRVDAHLAWLRANGQLPPRVELRQVFDEADETQRWLRRVLKRVGGALALSLLVVLAFLGRRAATVTLATFAVWLPLCAAVWWAVGMSLNVMTVAGAMLAGVVVVLLAARIAAAPLVVALALAAAAAGWWGEAPFGIAAQTLAGFCIASLLAIPVAWLMLAYSRADEAAAPLARWLPGRAWRVPVMAALLLAAVIAGVRSLPVAVADVSGGVLRLRVHGQDEVRLVTLVDELAATLRALPGVSEVTRAPVREERWQLQLEAERLAAAGVGIAEVGRAFEIAHSGLVVGELVSADAQLPLRIQLASGAAGAAFERLPLRGEHKDRHALYLRDVGHAVRTSGWHERLRAQRLPAAELRARWRGAQPPAGLAQLGNRAPLPAGYGMRLELTPIAADLREAVNPTD